jgi:hypothetical protein
MSTSPSNPAPGLGGWFVLVLMLPGFLVLVGVVVAFVFGKARRGGPEAAPGYYHVMGIDRRTNEPRAATFHAAGEAAARGRAELDGILVTDVRRVQQADPP